MLCEMTVSTKIGVLRDFRPFKAMAVIAIAASIFSLGHTTFSQEKSEEQELTPEEAHAEFMAEIEKSIDWKQEGAGKIENFATLEIPAGYRFAGGKGTEELMVMFGNPPGDGYRKGMIAPENLEWFAIFMWDDRGYVEDDDRDEIDPDELLKDLKKSNKLSSEARAKAGYGRLDLVDWAYPPQYNPDTNNLEWALDLVDEDGDHVVNYETKILGRKGLIEAVLVCGPDELADYLPEFQSMLEGLTYTDGNKYTDFSASAGDKVAKGGLIALIAGGAVFAAAKTGLLSAILLWGKKLWYVVLAVIAGAVNWVKRLFGRGDHA